MFMYFLIFFTKNFLHILLFILLYLATFMVNKVDHNFSKSVKLCRSRLQPIQCTRAGHRLRHREYTCIDN